MKKWKLCDGFNDRFQEMNVCRSLLQHWPLKSEDSAASTPLGGVIRARTGFKGLGGPSQMFIRLLLPSTYERVEKTGPYSEAGARRVLWLPYPPDKDTINYASIRVFSEKAQVWIPKQHR
jgi:hypothetical protein